MKIETFNEIMAHLDIVENELNKIAEATGHVSFKEFTETQVNASERLKHAA